MNLVDHVINLLLALGEPLREVVGELLHIPGGGVGLARRERVDPTRDLRAKRSDLIPDVVEGTVDAVTLKINLITRSHQDEDLIGVAVIEMESGYF